MFEIKELEEGLNCDIIQTERIVRLKRKIQCTLSGARLDHCRLQHFGLSSL